MAEPIVNECRLLVRFEALEDLQGLPAVDDDPINNDGFNQELAIYSPTSTPVVDRASYQEYTIGGGGTVDIDLTALLSSQTAINATGKKVQGFIFVSPAGNAMVTIAPGATNAYDPFGAGNEFDLYAHASIDGFVCALQPEGLEDVAAGAKNIRISGTPTQIVKVGLWIG